MVFSAITSFKSIALPSIATLAAFVSVPGVDEVTAVKAELNASISIVSPP